MKKYLSIILINLITTIGSLVYCQVTNAKYIENEDYIEISRDSIEFRIKGNLTSQSTYCGRGTYSILKDKYLIIHTNDYSGEKSKIKKTNRKNNTIEIRIIDQNMKPISNANIIMKDSIGAIIWGTVTDSLGNANLRFYVEKSQLSISYVGYDYLTFEFDNDYDYLITLMDYNIVEQQNTIFRINNWEEEKIELTLLTFKYSNRIISYSDLESLNTYLKDQNPRIRVLRKSNN